MTETRQKKRLEKQWPLACKRAGLRGPDGGDVPGLRKVRPLGSGTLQATVRSGDIGIPVSDVQAAAATVAEIIGCREVVVDKVEPGVAKVTFHWRDPIGRVLPLADLPVAPKGRIAYGIRQDGSAATVNLMQSILIGGLTRHGKSNIDWSLLADLNRQGVPVEAYVSDPKEGLELQEFERAMAEAAALRSEPPTLLRIRSYAPDAKSTAQMVADAEKACKARKYYLKQDGVRKLEAPTAAHPLVVVILDEALALTAMLKQGEDSPLGRLLYMGATAGYVVWMNTQAAQLEILGNLRRFIPQRICVATDAPGNTDSVLGQYAESKGAKCSEIRDPGVGYSLAEGEARPKKFRAALVTDAETRDIARGRLPKKVADNHQRLFDLHTEATERKCGLYRWYHIDATPGVDRPGYIGESYNVMIREAQHNAALREFMQGSVKRTVEYYPSKKAAKAAEKAAIEAEQPIYNKAMNGRNPFRRVDQRAKVDA